MFVFSLEKEIFLTVHYLIVYLAFLTSHNPLFSVCTKPLKYQHFRFSVFFSKKSVQILIFKVDYLENDQADFNDFGLILSRAKSDKNTFCYIYNTFNILTILSLIFIKL